MLKGVLASKMYAGNTRSTLSSLKVRMLSGCLHWQASAAGHQGRCLWIGKQGVVVPPSCTKGNQRVCSNYRTLTLLCPPTEIFFLGSQGSVWFRSSSGRGPGSGSALKGAEDFQFLHINRSQMSGGSQYQISPEPLSEEVFWARPTEAPGQAGKTVRDSPPPE